jgi:hypothetical protein
VVPGDGFEPPTRTPSTCRSTQLSYPGEPGANRKIGG